MVDLRMDMSRGARGARGRAGAGAGAGGVGRGGMRGGEGSGIGIGLVSAVQIPQHSLPSSLSTLPSHAPVLRQSFCALATPASSSFPSPSFATAASSSPFSTSTSLSAFGPT
ncbi:unnamed protein product, partial [Closterium sp. NIES-54]